MNKEQFWAMAESWNQRTHKLRLITESELETAERKARALKLFLIMFGCMQKIAQAAAQVSMPKPPQSRRSAI